MYGVGMIVRDVGMTICKSSVVKFQLCLLADLDLLLSLLSLQGSLADRYCVMVVMVLGA